MKPYTYKPILSILDECIESQVNYGYQKFPEMTVYALGGLTFILCASKYGSVCM